MFLFAKMKDILKYYIFICKKWRIFLRTVFLFATVHDRMVFKLGI
jgi:hypothetical protein